MQIFDLRTFEPKSDASRSEAELRRLLQDEKALETLAPADPILRTFLAATRACRDQLERRAH